MGGGGGGSGVQRIEPPSYQLPYLQYGVGQAHSLYGQGPTVVPFSPQTEQAMQMTEQRAMQGSPVTRSAQDYVTRSLQGGFMGSANPYLQDTFNQAALATQNSLDSQYARAGRNVRAGEPIRAQQLNNLATGIFGSNYQFERGMQQGVLPYAGSLAEADYRDIGALAGVGGQVEGLAREYANAPGASLEQYLGRVSGNMGQTTTTQGPDRNRLLGALGGAATGAGIAGALGSGAAAAGLANPYMWPLVIGGGILGAYG